MESAVTESVTPWQRAWQKHSNSVMPTRLRNTRFMHYPLFATKVREGAEPFVASVVESLLAGDVWILKHGFDARWMKSLRLRAAEWMRANPSTFHKMLDGCPDFHRIIDPETGKAYAFAGCKQAAYFYRWNSDPLGIWPAITERWRVMKTVMGLAPDEYERNTASDGVVDRIQIVRYPPAIGFLEPHSDPWRHQRLFIGGYMSKSGVDYDGGGFYLADRYDQVANIENQLDIGDLSIGCATLVHGVAPCDRSKVPDWGKDDGRWFLSLYSNASDAVPDRHTGKPAPSLRLSPTGGERVEQLFPEGFAASKIPSPPVGEG